ncbi:DUF4184 family protein [Streptomyces sp. SP17BM10]|uniref:DUF4184 family protein n=1 Tax=Streptomyces sp. SP17BM10 TaxID=3002530 RepID=UPI002E7A3D00|nr:DUF4184 family protein [Streptomyces sp. SP17BM10]MEE1783597.1 DUF4184 family protein [Streptomyces sp. SP17BM10]
MPFTFSHPAAVLPLLRAAGERGPLVASALVAGSMAPDVPFFAESLLPGVYGHGGLTHRWWAVPTLDVAIAGALVVGWHGLLRGPLVALLPERWTGAAEALTLPRGGVVAAVRGRGPETAARAGWFAVSAAVGAATHVGWDAFTHEGRLGVRLLPVLDREVAGVPLYSALQYGSSALALAAVGGWAVRAARAVEPVRPAVVLSPRGRRAAAVALGLATAAGVAHRISPLRRGLIPEFCFGAGAGFTVGAAGYAAAVAAVVAARRRRPGAAAGRAAGAVPGASAGGSAGTSAGASAGPRVPAAGAGTTSVRRSAVRRSGAGTGPR